MATKKTTEGEEEYFARLEKQKKDELRAKLAADEKKAGEKAKPASKGSMKCPKCDTRLETLTYKGVEVDRCESCNGIFLDDGELETLAAAPNSGGFFRGFLKSLKKGN